jgi:hypothetical protein
MITLGIVLLIPPNAASVPPYAGTEAFAIDDRVKDRWAWWFVYAESIGSP